MLNVTYSGHKNLNFGKLLLPLLSSKDRESLGLVNKAWQIAKQKFVFKCLKNKLRTKAIVFIKDDTGIHQEKLLSLLGQGGSKKAYQLDGGRALIVPNMGSDFMDGIFMNWRRYVDEEVAMSQFLTEIGILSPLSRRVTLSLAQDFNEAIPAYISETFQNLTKTKGWSIIDSKNAKTCTWILEKDFLFNSEKDRLEEKNWDSVVDSVLTDVAKIALYKIPIKIDSLNFAIIKKPSQSTASQFEIRYFGFDFSDKYEKLSMPTIEKKSLEISYGDEAREALNSILDYIFFVEFGRRYELGPERENLKDFKNQLVERYIEVVISRMSDLAKNS